MKVSATPNVIIIQENPGCIWLFGLFFAVIGGIFVYGSLGGFVNFGLQEFWNIVIALALGMCGIAAGIWIIYNAPMSIMTVDRLANQVSIVRYGIFGKRTNSYNFEQIERFCLIESKDSEGDSIWNFGLKLTNGDEIPFTSLGKHAEDYEQQYVFITNQFTGKQLPIHELIFEIEDESPDEIG